MTILDLVATGDDSAPKTSVMKTAIVLFTQDLRVHDNPALATACAEADQVVPLFVLDETILKGPFGVPNRTRFLLDALTDLRGTLRDRGGDLVIRQGDPVTETVRVAEETGADRIYLAEGVSRYATDRLRRLEGELAVRTCPGLTVVPPGELTPASGDHYRVFTPYWRAWCAARWRTVAPTPESLRLPSSLSPGAIPKTVGEGTPAPDLMAGGETVVRDRVHAWFRSGLADYDDRHDDLAGDATSRFSPYLRFGCLSALEVAVGARNREGGEEFCRQLAWRDFHHQVTAAFPDLAVLDYRPRDTHWTNDTDAIKAWREGMTGIPIVDAGMRQLIQEGWMHNRSRMIVASFLTKNLGCDWRHGYAHFRDLLVDGDVANNAGNWQWVAGTGNDTRPNRVLNPLRQATRFDPDGIYVRRYVPELADIEAPTIHTPWELPAALKAKLGYPPPIAEPTIRRPR
jgi:deoxyribodipyrimidine photo-lyase